MLIGQFVDLIPRKYATYVEPFLGGGALFFAMRAERAVLSDACFELVQTYEAVRDEPDQVLRHLSQWTPNKEFFYKMRASRSSDRIERAAEFVYLNKTCWNGLYRVNAAGNFNVPYGAPKSDNLIDATNLRACARLLSKETVTLRTLDFRASLSIAGKDDFVFLDPPYVTGHNNNGFIDYNENLFSWNDQVATAELAKAAADRGATVIVTNAYHQDVLDLYPDFQVRALSRSSTIASNAKKRTTTKEAIFWRGPRQDGD